MSSSDEGLDDMIQEGEIIIAQGNDKGHIRAQWSAILNDLPATSVPYFGVFNDPRTKECIGHAHTLDVLKYVSPLLEFCIEGLLLCTDGGASEIDPEWAAQYRDSYLDNPESRCSWMPGQPFATAEFREAVKRLETYMITQSELHEVCWLFVYQNGLEHVVLGSKYLVSSEYPIIAFLQYTLGSRVLDVASLNTTIMVGAFKKPDKEPYLKFCQFLSNWRDK